MDQNLSIEAMHMAHSVLRLLRPHAIRGKRKARIGRLFDGGYVMLDDLAGVEAAYSLGINDDVSWDLDVVARDIPIYQYDHTIERLPAEHPLFHWEKIGITGEPAGDGMETIPGLLRKNGHDNASNLLLKCDIEGHEWGVFAGMASKDIGRFSQITMEMHGFGQLASMRFSHVARRALQNLWLTHRVIHVHGNNFAPWSVVGGIPIPEVLEVSFARLDQGEFVLSDEVFPTALDMPCYSQSADLFLGRFVFE